MSAPSSLSRSQPGDWADDDTVRAELERLAAVQQELLAAAGLVAAPPAESAEHEAVDSRDEAHLQAENMRLRACIEDLRQQLQASTELREQTWAEQQREYEALLEEKSEVIRSLHLQNQELKQAVEQAEPASSPEELGNARALQRELQALRQRLEQERKQLQEDEQAVQEQLRQMELALSRERVELARQRAEVQRLQSDFQHELETAARDEKLRERLLPLQRRNQELANSKGASAAPPPRPASVPQLSRPATMTQLQRPGPGGQANVEASTDTSGSPPRPGSGLLRRLFGKRD